MAIAIGGCASRPVPIDSRIVSVGGQLPSDWPTAALAPPNVVPAILRIHLNALRVRPGEVWSGRIATGTNVASVEIRTELFSFNAQRTAFGQFAFTQRIIDLPGIFQRGYVLRVIARNAAGLSTEEDLPFRFTP